MVFVDFIIRQFQDCVRHNAKKSSLALKLELALQEFSPATCKDSHAPSMPAISEADIMSECFDCFILSIRLWKAGHLWLWIVLAKQLCPVSSCCAA